jgi:hypothetical protein
MSWQNYYDYPTTAGEGRRMKLDLTNLKRGDVLVLRDGTRRTFYEYDEDRCIFAKVLTPRPCNWWQDGTYDGDGHEWDIVRVIREKAKKAKPDKDAAWLLKLHGPPAMLRRLRAIAKRLNNGRKV